MDTGRDPSIWLRVRSRVSSDVKDPRDSVSWVILLPASQISLSRFRLDRSGKGPVNSFPLRSRVSMASRPLSDAGNGPRRPVLETLLFYIFFFYKKKK
jgi:hypothetical protein